MIKETLPLPPLPCGTRHRTPPSGLHRGARAPGRQRRQGGRGGAPGTRREKPEARSRRRWRGREACGERGAERRRLRAAAPGALPWVRREPRRSGTRPAREALPAPPGPALGRAPGTAPGAAPGPLRIAASAAGSAWNGGVPRGSAARLSPPPGRPRDAMGAPRPAPGPAGTPSAGPAPRAAGLQTNGGGDWSPRRAGRANRRLRDAGGAGGIGQRRSSTAPSQLPRQGGADHREEAAAQRPPADGGRAAGAGGVGGPGPGPAESQNDRITELENF